MHYISICLIVRDDHRYIKEWLSYHRLLGIDHFYIYDNLSQPPLQSILQPYINQGLVTYHYDTRTRPQISVYNECLRDYGKDNIWIAFIDSDEFLVLKKHKNIKEFLRNYERYGSVVVSWYLFGSNGYWKRQKSVIKSYTKRVPRSSHLKSIVRAAHVKSVTVHWVTDFIDGYYSVDETKTKFIPRITRRPPTNYIQLNHYVLRSKQDFKDKLKRGGGTNPHSRSISVFQNINRRATVTDTTIIRVIRKLRRISKSKSKFK